MTIDVENFSNRRNDERWNRVSVGDIIERMTWNEPDKVALVATPDATVDPAYARVTYSQANTIINRVANALLALDLAPSSRIAMLCNNSNEAWLAKVGVAKAGLVAAPVNVMMAPDVIVEALDRARELGLDRAEVRRRNLISPADMPYTSPLKSRDGANIVLDSGDFIAGQDKLLDLIDYEGFPSRQKAALSDGRYLGIGIGNYTKGTGRGPFESAIVRIKPSGQITVATGASEQGQGIIHSLAQICAEALGVNPEAVSVTGGDTSAVSIGMGTFASRQAVTAGTSVHVAATELRNKALKIGAHMLEAAEEDLELVDGMVRVRGVPEMAVPLGKIAHAVAGTPGFALPFGIEPGMEAEHNFMPEGLAYCSGSQAAEVEVDVETGGVTILRYIAVQDSGTRINPMIVDGQMQGGIVHGMGNALFERLHHDENGQPLTTTLDQYLLPTATGVPSIALHYDDTACTKNPLGIKGVGEGGTVPVPGVIISAVENALSPFGIFVDRCPIEPMHLVELILAAQQ